MMRLTSSSSIPLVVAAALWIAAGLIVGETLGDDVQVNTYTTSHQSRPSVAWGADGQFVVVWQSHGSYNSPNTSIQAQRYAADDSPIGGQFQVNSYLTSSSFAPSVAMASSGEFVVAWSRLLATYPDVFGAVQAQRLAADGSPIGGEFQVNTDIMGTQRSPSIAMRPTGEFVVVWSTYNYLYPHVDFDLNGQLFTADGTPVGNEFQVNSADYVYYHSVAMGPGGHFVVVWGQPDGYYQTVLARLYASDGSSLGDTFQVNEDSDTLVDHRQPSVASNADGEFIVAWTGLTYTSFNEEIHARRLAADGAPLGDQFKVSTYTSSYDAASPSVASDAAGNFIVAWHSDGSSGTDTSATSVHARFYASDDSPLSDEFQVNTYTTDDQHRPSVAMGPAGGYAIVWSSEGSHGTDTSSWSIQKTPGALIFADGFESGDTSAW